MSYYDAFDLALYNRLNGDSTLTAIVGTRIHNAWEPAVQEGAQPSLCYTRMPNPVRKDAWPVRGTEYRFMVDVFVESNPGGTAGSDFYDGLAIGRSIIARVQGDWPTQASPTYGLDRYGPDITATGYRADPIGMEEDWTELHEAGVYRWQAPFMSLISIGG